MPGSEDEQVLAPTDGVEDGELAGRRDCRVEQGRGDVHRLLDEASCHGGVVERQGLHDLRVLLRESLHRHAAADGGQDQAESLVAESWHVQMRTLDAPIPGQTESTDAAAETSDDETTDSESGEVTDEADGDSEGQNNSEESA